MSGLARIILLLALICCGGPRAGSHPSGSAASTDSYAGKIPDDQVGAENQSESQAPPRLGLVISSPADHGRGNTTVLPEPSGRQPTLPYEVSDASANWTELQSRIRAEEKTLAACRSGDSPCPAAARRFLSIVELGRRRQGRAQLGEINRAVNLSIKPVSDWTQYGVDDYWSAPIATLSAGAGDCEDYAIVKYLALRESGISPDDLQLLIVRDIKRHTNHAVLAVHQDEGWLILDNRTLIMVDAEEARHYYP
jgi:predicted transglutaminase-like cysteine proteinase